ncbi:MAG TPA: indolepyruvate ferredoxin oxidoreductase family protein [Solirubrobacteraceae bacterium]|nr:indolepyruvate ferredoxin oxidoreductase family protein [Solirubrobacteraceae bacterium]
MSAATLARRDATTEDRYEAPDGLAILTGIHALVRVTLDQRRLDAQRGLDTRVFVSGYPGSPLGGVDIELRRAQRHLDALGVRFQPGLNEELAATAVAGTQLLGELAGRRHDGVTGIWFGKSPGLDRAADAIRHGNVSGTAPLGGAVAWIGDDPMSKSSTIASSCEPMCRSLLLPLLAPGTVPEVLALGLHAVAMSRHAGLWAGLKLTPEVADASASVDLGAPRRAIPVLDPRERFKPPMMLAPANLDAEEDLLTGRLARALDYVRAAGLNRIVRDAPRPRLAIVAAGVAHEAVLRALDELGLGEHAPLRVVKLAMPWPLDREEIRGLLAGAERVLVVEDKFDFLEGGLRDVLYGGPETPPVLGRELLPARSAVGADDVARALGRLLGPDELPERARSRLALLAEGAPAAAADLARRTPYFCSGCPHNVSTRAAPDTLVGVGIGCHTMVAIDSGERRGHLLGICQMGGEGGHWIGLAPFTNDRHIVQNLGDGTFHHSGSLAIRAAVAAGANITFRLLYNGAVAMTGGQTPPGNLDVPTLTKWLELEGVRRVIVTGQEAERYRATELGRVTSVRHRDEIPQALAELAAIEGVTVLIHDDRCATEERRLRKRGKLPTPPERVFINERVCEGCGDCGEQSTCLSVVPVATPFGRKTQIHQASCNQDLTCLKGDCPSFLVVTPPAGGRPRPAPTDPPFAPREPERRVGEDVLVRMPGVGGTGVLTVSAILQMAAHLDGRFAAGLDQIGLAQKGGPVITDVRISGAPIAGAVRASRASADVLLGLDLLGAAAADTLAVADPDRTIAVLNVGVAPTAAMVTDRRNGLPDPGRAVARVAAVTREHVALDALGLAERLLGDHLPSNVIMLGAAYQYGCLPVSAAALEQAIRLNGTAVDVNLAAFRWGRAVVAEPACAGPAPAAPEFDLARCAAELEAFQDRELADRYVREVEQIAAIERDRVRPDSAAVSEAFARGLYKLLAYKDEYEVARLHLLAEERARVDEAFGAGAEVKVLLHPPALRARGLQRKLQIPGRVAFPALRALYGARRLRGTALDPFGRAEVRRVERALADEYRALMARALARLDASTVDRVVAVAELPDLVRGYEQIKLRGVAEFRSQAAAALAELERPCAELPLVPVTQ